MTPCLPDFIIGGAPRCGTTSLATALDLHPDIWLAKPLRPEPKFFLVDELYAQGLDWYASRWFADAPADAVLGEKSTNYLESPTAARRIAHDLPDARLIFVLREPTRRAISNYQWSVMNGMETEDFATALRLEEERESTVPPPLAYARPHAYFSRGRYADMLKPFVALLPPEQILVLRFEDLVAAPGLTVARVHSFLGVDPRPDLAGQPEGLNASVTAGDVDAATVARLHAAYRPSNRELAALLGPSFALWTETEGDE